MIYQTDVAGGVELPRTAHQSEQNQDSTNQRLMAALLYADFLVVQKKGVMAAHGTPTGGQQ